MEEAGKGGWQRAGGAGGVSAGTESAELSASSFRFRSSDLLRAETVTRRKVTTGMSTMTSTARGQLFLNECRYLSNRKCSVFGQRRLGRPGGAAPKPPPGSDWRSQSVCFSIPSSFMGILRVRGRWQHDWPEAHLQNLPTLGWRGVCLGQGWGCVMGQIWEGQRSGGCAGRRETPLDLNRMHICRKCWHFDLSTPRPHLWPPTPHSHPDKTPFGWKHRPTLPSLSHRMPLKWQMGIDRLTQTAPAWRGQTTVIWGDAAQLKSTQLRVADMDPRTGCCPPTERHREDGVNSTKAVSEFPHYSLWSVFTSV